MTTQTHPIIVERGGTVEARADALGLAALLGPKDQAIGNSSRGPRPWRKGRLSSLGKESPLPSLAAVPDRN